MPTTTQTRSQGPLVDAALAEQRRRAERRRSLGTGQMVALSTDAAAAHGVQPHDRLAHVTAARGNLRDILTLQGTAATVALEELRAAAQPGDRVDGGLVIAVDVDPDGSPRALVSSAAPAGPGTDLPGVSYAPHAVAVLPVGSSAPFDVVAPHTVADLGESCALRGCDSSGGIGPGLCPRDGAVRQREPGTIRAGVASAKVGDRATVLVDFLGGATLWVWRDLLCPAPVIGLPDDPLCDARGVWAPLDLVERCRPGAEPLTQGPASATLAPVDPAAAALQARAARPALSGGRTDSPSAGAPPALSAGDTTMSTTLAPSPALVAAIEAASAPAPVGSIVKIAAAYRDYLPALLKDIEAHYGVCRNISLASDVTAECSDAIPGLYEVIEVRTLRYAKGSVAVLKIQTEDPDGTGDELHVLQGIGIEVKGGALAPAVGAGGALATASRGAKGLVSAATSGAKSVARKTGQIAVAEGKRKAAKAAKEFGGDTVFDVYEGVKGAAAQFMEAFGLERFIPAMHVAADVAATSGAHMLGEALQETSPKLASVLVAVSETIEDKQAQRTAAGVRAALAPAVEAIREGFGQAAGRMLAPALQTLGALPAPADEDDSDEAGDAEEAKPAKKSAARKPKAKAARKPKAAKPAADDVADSDDDAADGEEG